MSEKRGRISKIGLEEEGRRKEEEGKREEEGKTVAGMVEGEDGRQETTAAGSQPYAVVASHADR